MNRNVDTLSLSPPGGLHGFLGGIMNYVNGAELFDSEINTGTKKLSQMSLERLKLFAEYVFDQNEATIVAAGHSLWFKSFFNVFLPQQTEHVCKKMKIRNAGVVAFDIVQDTKGNIQILPDSITSVYLGFCKTHFGKN